MCMDKRQSARNGSLGTSSFISPEPLLDLSEYPSDIIYLLPHIIELFYASLYIVL